MIMYITAPNRNQLLPQFAEQQKKMKDLLNEFSSLYFVSIAISNCFLAAFVTYIFTQTHNCCKNTTNDNVYMLCYSENGKTKFNFDAYYFIYFYVCTSTTIIYIQKYIIFKQPHHTPLHTY